MRTKKTWVLCIAVSIFFILAIKPNRVSAKPLGKRIVLDNGTTLIVAERPGVPMIVVDVLVKAGSVFEPDEKAGLANLAAELLAQGTTKRTAAEIAQMIDSMGASLSVDADYDYMEANLVILRKFFDKGLEILGDILINATFASEEIEKKVREIEGELKKNQEDPGWVAEREFLGAVFNGYPYGRMVDGDEASIKRINRSDIVDFHSNYYLPNRTIIAIAGDITLQEAKNLIEKTFVNWDPKEITERKISPPLNLKKNVSLRLDRKVNQANIIIGHLGISRDNPDYYALQVMNYILGGGGFSSRLVNEIRDKMGLAYSVSSDFISRKYAGYFQVELQTKNQSATEAIQLVMKSVKRIRESAVSEKELEDAKAYLIGSLPLDIETNKEVAENMALLEFFSLGLDYFDIYPGYIKTVNERDVLSVAQKYLHPENLVLVILADMKETKGIGT